MTPAPKPLRVEPILNEPTRFWVTSETKRSISYLVDLVEHHYNGQCDCTDFRTRCAVALRDDPKGGPYRCKHLLAAREAALDRTLAAYEAERLAR